MLNIGKAAVLGAGTMGAAIAAHLSNAGIPMLDWRNKYLENQALCYNLDRLRF